MPEKFSEEVHYYTTSELNSYTDQRTKGLADKSVRWIRKARDIFYSITEGTISVATISHLRDHVLNTFKSRDSWGKVFNFAIAFLRHLSKIHFNQEYRKFEAFLEMPKSIREVKLLTARIITTEDVRACI